MEVFDIIDSTVVIAIVIVIVIVQFGGGEEVCRCLLSQNIFSARVYARMNNQLGRVVATQFT